ncbi:RNA 2',3'-cyclic phosphodiesterase [Methanocalculus sp.]|uniref:RNA 2',3'-cyclic phosphodiesterase n=1 Tax=Methanocalculus sp. TaxID=2004547 RepID=UPI0018596C12|nr:RNA 2',3'-cyclic phosphodiesterase [Methanocalculus sp.]HIJ06808.1 RNA 2',3'-cyclic phosphodiesterase [Methanocalculus sp.]
MAIDLLPSLREAFSIVQEPLRQCSGRLSIVDPELLHITLKFLGELPAEQVVRVSGELKTLKFPPFSVSITGISANNPKDPRVIWAVVEDGGKTAALAEAVGSVIAPLGFSPETRPFRPHITIARVKEYHPDIPRAIAPFYSWNGGGMPVDRILLKKSTLTPQGSIYETLTEVPL